MRMTIEDVCRILGDLVEEGVLKRRYVDGEYRYYITREGEKLARKQGLL